MNQNGRLTVTAVNRTAELAGAAPGQSLADARALAPETAAADADPAADARALDRLADWCGRYTPWAAVDRSSPADLVGGGGLWLDITGCAHLFGGEAQLIADLVNRLAGFGLTARAAAADTAGAAWAWARFGDPARPILEGGTQPEALAPLPVHALRLTPADADTLVRLGLRTVGELVRIPRASLAARFGDGVRDKLDRAFGNAREPLSPAEQRPPEEERRAFAEPVMTPDALARVLADLLVRMAARLERRGLGARRLTYTLYRIDGSTARATVGTSRPVREPRHLARLFAPKLEALDPEPGVEVAVLAAPLTAPFETAQGAMKGATVQAGGAVLPAEAAELLDRLANRLGGERVGRLAPREAALPEARAAFAPGLAEAPAGWGNWPEVAPGSTGPLRLLPKAEPLEDGAEDKAADHDAPPATFTWRRREHRVRRAEGPERLLGPWWRGDESARDYYRIEDQDGRGFWLYRDLATRRWYLHGLAE